MLGGIRCSAPYRRAPDSTAQSPLELELLVFAGVLDGADEERPSDDEPPDDDEPDDDDPDDDDPESELDEEPDAAAGVAVDDELSEDPAFDEELEPPRLSVL